METILNHTYKVKYQKPTTPFIFEQKNSIVGFESYKDKILPYINDISYELYMNPKSRQAWLPVSEGIKGSKECLIGYDFQLDNDILYVTGIQRSQASDFGRKYDEELINYIIFLLLNTSLMRIQIKPTKVDITMFICNYHDRPDISE